MSSYTIEELIARWKREELTVEQMIGQMLQVLREQERRLRELGWMSASNCIRSSVLRRTTCFLGIGDSFHHHIDC